MSNKTKKLSAFEVMQKEQQTIELQQQNIEDNKVIKKQLLPEKLSEKIDADTCTLKRKNDIGKTKGQKKKKLVKCSNIVSSNENVKNVIGDGEKCDVHKEQIDASNNDEQLVEIVDVEKAFLSKQNTQLQPMVTLLTKEDSYSKIISKCVDNVAVAKEIENAYVKNIEGDNDLIVVSDSDEKPMEIFDVDKLFASKGNTKKQKKSKLKKKEIGMKTNLRDRDSASLGTDFRTDIVKDVQDVKKTEIMDQIVISDDDEGSVEIICDDGVMVTEEKPRIKKKKNRKRKIKEMGSSSKILSINDTVNDIDRTHDEHMNEDGITEDQSWLSVGQMNNKINTSKVSLSITTDNDFEGKEESTQDDSSSFFSDRPTAITTDSGVLVVIKHPCEFALKGYCRIQAVIGTINIMGYCLPTKSGQKFNVFSPDCYSLVTLATRHGEEDVTVAMDTIEDQVDGLNSENQASLKSALDLSLPFVVIKVERLQTSLGNLYSSLHPFSSVFKVAGDRSHLNKQLLPLNVIIPWETELPTIHVSAELQNVIDKWNAAAETTNNSDHLCMLVCGGKDSGKSTTNRIIMNATLNRCDSLYYLECDVGQAEFTPAGVVSLLEVTEPVFGPPFCHQKKPLCSYLFGGMSPQDDPDFYIQCIQLCVQKWLSLNTSSPLIVNTMGWMKGLGWQLLLDTIRLLNPTHIVQLASNQRSQNVYPLSIKSLSDLSWSQLSQNLSDKGFPTDVTRQPNFMYMEQTLSPSFNFKMKPVDYRDLNIIAHLGMDLDPGMTLTSMIPYTVYWRDVGVHVCHQEVSRSQIMYALNASLVALCETDLSETETLTEDGPKFFKRFLPCKWIGYGIVRGIDPQKKLFYIITSVPVDCLARVNAIMKGGVCVPETLFTSQKCGKLLYVDEVVSSVGLSAIKARKHMPRKNLSGYKA